jgi:hypothetical protein
MELDKNSNQDFITDWSATKSIEREILDSPMRGKDFELITSSVSRNVREGPNTRQNFTLCSSERFSPSYSKQKIFRGIESVRNSAKMIFCSSKTDLKSVWSSDSVSNSREKRKVRDWSDGFHKLKSKLYLPLLAEPGKITARTRVFF